MVDFAALLVLSGAGLAVSVREPAWGLLLLFASTFIEVRTDGPGGLTVFASEALLTIVFAAWAVARGREFLRDCTQRPLLTGAAVFLAVMLVSAAFAGSRGEAVRAVVRWMEFLGVLLMASDAGRRGTLSWRSVMGALALAVIVLSALALWDARPWLLRPDSSPERITLRVPGGLVVWRASGFNQPNVLAALLFPGAALCAAYWIALPATFISRAALAAAVAGGAMVLLTYSRAGLLAYLLAMAAVLVACITAPDRRRRLVRLGFLAAAAALAIRAVAAPEALAEQFRSVRATGAKVFRIAGGTVEGKTLRNDLVGSSTHADIAVGTLDDRKLMAETAGRVVHDNPWLGAGPGNWRVAAPARAAVGMDAAGLTHHPHNLYLLVLSETGLAGLSAFIFLLLTLFWKAPWAAPWPERMFRFAWAGLLAAFLVYSVFDVPTIHARGMNMAFLLGFLRWPFNGDEPR